MDELTFIAFSNIADVVDQDGRVRALNDIPEPTTRALRLFVRRRTRSGTTVKVALWDKIAALRVLAKYHALLADRIEPVGSGEVALTTEQVARMSDREIADLAQAIADEVNEIARRLTP